MIVIYKECGCEHCLGIDEIGVSICNLGACWCDEEQCPINE